jgi:DNA adenine methylase
MSEQIRSPIKWAGGKYRIRNKILALLPDHNCYVEVFGGAGWVLFAKPQSEVEIFNDLDGDLINFFEVVKNKPEELIQSFDLNLVSRRLFEHYRYLHEDEKSQLSDIEKAHHFYYLIMAAWGGEYGNPRFQTSVSDKGGHGNRLIGGLKSLRERILPAHQRLSTVIIENLDWRKCIERYDRPYDQNKVVMYLDPPYPGNNVNYQHNMTSFNEHVEMVQVLTQMKSRFLLSTYNLPEIRKLYPLDRFNILDIDFQSGMPTNGPNNHRNKEIIVTNFEHEPG